MGPEQWPYRDAHVTYARNEEIYRCNACLAIAHQCLTKAKGVGSSLDGRTQLQRRPDPKQTNRPTRSSVSRYEGFSPSVHGKIAMKRPETQTYDSDVHKKLTHTTEIEGEQRQKQHDKLWVRIAKPKVLNPFVRLQVVTDVAGRPKRKVTPNIRNNTGRDSRENRRQCANQGCPHIVTAPLT